MQFTINRKELVGVLGKIQGITSRKTNLAISSTVLLQATGQEVIVKATDQESSFEGRYAANVTTEGIIAINSRKFFEIVRDFPSDSVLIHEVQDNWVQISNEKVQFHIVCMNHEDFPGFEAWDDVDFFSIEAPDFRRMVEKSVVIGFVGEETRAHVAGCLLELADNDGQKVLRMVSTDSSRLSTVDYSYPEETLSQLKPGLIISKKGLIEVEKFLDYNGPVLLGAKGNHLIVKMVQEVFSIRLLEGIFPEYKDIVFRVAGHEILINRQLFLLMLKRMTILYTENYKSVIFTFQDNKLVIHSSNPDIGESNEDMEVPYDGEILEIAFNPKYFMDALNMIEDENVVLRIVNEKTPCILEGEKDKSFLTVIMPMRI